MVFVVSGLGFLMAQSAFRAGPLSASLSALSSINPVASVTIGATVFGEAIQLQGLSPLLALLGLVAVLAGTIALASSTVVQSTRAVHR